MNAPYLLSQQRPPKRNGTLAITLAISLALNVVAISLASKSLRESTLLPPLDYRMVTDLFESLDDAQRTYKSNVDHLIDESIAEVNMDLETQTTAPISFSTPLTPVETSAQRRQASLAPARRQALKAPTRRTAIEDRKTLKQKYQRMVHTYIQTALREINPTRDGKGDDKVALRVRIETNSGLVKNIDFVKRADNWRLNEAAVLAVKRAQPFPPLDVKIAELNFIIPFTY